MTRTESAAFDEGVGAFLDQSFALLNVERPPKGMRKKDAQETLVAAITEVNALRRTTSPAEFTAMEHAAQLMLQEVVNGYKAGVDHG